MKAGDTFIATLTKELIVSDSEQFWVALSENGERFLMDKKPYESYAFEAGKQIRVTVDKINCSGKIFLEPDHPVYEREKTYEFSVSSIISANHNEWSLVVSDVFGHSIPIQYHSETGLTLSAALELKVIGLRKGKPILLDPALQKLMPFHENETYQFLVADSTYIDQMQHFLLEDRFGRRHLLPEEPYRNYNIKIGNNIRCEVVRIGQNGQLTLEPMHPQFSLGQEIELTMVKRYDGPAVLGSRHELYLLNDLFENSFYMSARFLKDKAIPKKLRCRIEKFKKGQILVEPIED